MKWPCLGTGERKVSFSILYTAAVLGGSDALFLGYRGKGIFIRSCIAGISCVGRAGLLQYFVSWWIFDIGVESSCFNVFIPMHKEAAQRGGRWMIKPSVFPRTFSSDLSLGQTLLEKLGMGWREQFFHALVTELSL